MFHSYPKLLDQ